MLNYYEHAAKYWYVFGRLDQFVTVSRLVWNIAKYDDNGDEDDGTKWLFDIQKKWRLAAAAVMARGVVVEKKTDDNGTK